MLWAKKIMKALVVLSGTAAVSFYSVDTEFEQYIHKRLQALAMSISSVSTIIFLLLFIIFKA